ncbi:betaine/proline/choline family ABC transporter ATP-binding protein [Nosocomiicoccus ampullae]|uniref:Quaternary amine transport ATP-binding protein n=1 Tax=Nosocomiicoccus ampullae TaxID=489910 RepID=A0A9Q2D0V5_9STAP|nr:betaine/proline/choline family ABC transporter ATP-binding protein [Nosocomiicoccus ampullae]MBB5176596.1 osmoprotectant transport system ATP-binding protein [Nosocomiicoccus ampullae]QYA46819.1 betaine/proline/choline family ABC transporter ATP-binding protein [Nosocomiicoccus ampullae]
MISFRNVTKAYGDFLAVDHISFDIESNELFVIIGPSGSGKTTTMEMINRLTDMTEGDIYIDDKNIKDINKVELRRSIGYVIQDIGLMPHMTISDNISLVNRLKGGKKDEGRIEELLRLVNMDDSFKDRYPEELSGGQQQRIGVIRALYSDPNIILMDEAFSALDPVTRSELQDEFIYLQETIKKTIVFVTHDMDEALKIADRIAVMKDGKIEQIGTPEELIFNPNSIFVQNFIGEERQRKYIMEHFKVKDFTNKSYPKVLDESKDELISIMKQQRISKIPVKIENNYYAYDLFRLLEDDFELEDVVALKENTDFNTAMNTISANKEKLHIVVDEANNYTGVLDIQKLFSMLSTDSKRGEAYVE